MASSDTRKVKIEKKLRKKVTDVVVDAILSCSVQELEDRLTRLATHETDTEEALEEDKIVTDLRERLAQARGPYQDTLKGIKLQRLFIAITLAERGKVVSGVI
jgi:hypothetical protein